MSRAETMKTVAALKQAGEDAEFYPSSDEIILKVVSDMCVVLDEFHYSRNEMKSVMDIGAGDGRVLKAIQKGMKERNPHSPLIECYAIEKAMFHLSNMPKDITVVGTDFEQQALADKPVGSIFCNPPYSQFVDWTLKILREGSTRWVYLVIPRRWRDNIDIKRAIDARLGEVTSLGEFDFLDADRKANAYVELIRVEFSHKHDDAFDRVIEDMMPELDIFDVELDEEAASSINHEVFQASSNLVEVLVDSYDRDLMSMLQNYKSALSINVRILKELGVCKAGMLKAIRQKISGLKHEYWKTLFDEMGTIKTRLATKQRKAFLQSLRDKVMIDFTANNVYSMLIWVSKWANDFFDEQLIELFRTLSTDSHVEKYKSNQRIWEQVGWRYNKKSNFSGEGNNQATHYKLEYRMVLSHGGISTSQWAHDRDKSRGLSDSAFDLLNDVVTVANNLGFPCSDHPRNYEWKSNKKNVLKLNDGKPLVAVRAFQNGNMHLHFDQKFMLAINVEAGRLLKWIRNPAEAVTEMQVTGEEAKQVEAMFGSSFRISPDEGMLRLSSKV
jgi:hypothetical protein